MKILRAAVLFAALGCGGGSGKPGMPDVVEAEGTVTINGQPLPNATVTFTPGGNTSADAIATGVSDQAGKFKLTCGGKPGAAVGENIVTVTEGPAAAEDRTEQAEQKAPAAQKNRPIPPDYGTVLKSGLKVTVAPGKKDYPIELKR